MKIPIKNYSDYLYFCGFSCPDIPQTFSQRDATDLIHPKALNRHSAHVISISIPELNSSALHADTETDALFSNLRTQRMDSLKSTYGSWDQSISSDVSKGCICDSLHSTAFDYVIDTEECEEDCVFDQAIDLEVCDSFVDTGNVKRISFLEDGVTTLPPIYEVEDEECDLIELELCSPLKSVEFWSTDSLVATSSAFNNDNTRNCDDFMQQDDRCQKDLLHSQYYTNSDSIMSYYKIPLSTDSSYGMKCKNNKRLSLPIFASYSATVAAMSPCVTSNSIDDLLSSLNVFAPCSDLTSFKVGVKSTLVICQIVFLIMCFF